LRRRDERCGSGFGNTPGEGDLDHPRKAWHEETKATVRDPDADGKSHYLVVFSLEETDYVCSYIRDSGDKAAFLEKVQRAAIPRDSTGCALRRVGVANQTTMLRGETEEGSGAFTPPSATATASARSGNTSFFDTNLRRDAGKAECARTAAEGADEPPAGRGGYNSSNTSHLAEMARRSCRLIHQEGRKAGLARRIRITTSTKDREVFTDDCCPREQ